MNKVQAIEYRRYSSELQRGNSSFARQERLAKEVLEKELNAEIVEVIEDDGVSAKDGNNFINGNFRKLYDMDLEGKIIFFSDWSRCGRSDFFTFTDAIRPLIMRGAKLVFGRDEDGEPLAVDKSNINKRSVINKILAGQGEAEHYLTDLTNKLTAAWLEKHEKLKKGEPVPLAWYPPWLKRCPRDGSGNCIKGVPYEIDEAKAKIVREIFDLYVNRFQGALPLARYLNANQVPVVVHECERYGKSGWIRNTVARLLKNKAVIGIHQHRGWAKKKVKLSGKTYLRPNDEILWESQVYPPIIDEKLFAQAQRLISQNQGGSGRPCSYDFVNVLAKIVKCSFCGNNIALTASYTQKNADGTSKRVRYLNCYHSRNKDCQSQKQMVRLGCVESIIRTILEKDSVLQDLLKAPKVSPSRVPEFKSELELVDRKRKNLLALVERVGTLKDVDTRIKELADEEAKLHKLIKAEEIRVNGDIPVVKAMVDNYKVNLQSSWENPEARKQIKSFICLVFEKIEINTVEKSIVLQVKGSRFPIKAVLFRNHWEVNGNKFPY